MNRSKIKPEDVELLCEVLSLPKESIVYDPERVIKESKYDIARDITVLLKQANNYHVCINLSGQNLEVLSFEYILEINGNHKAYRSFYRTAFLAVDNPDQSIRWFLPEDSKKPNFLELYNGSGMKAALFSFASQIAFRMKLKKWICNKSFSLYSKEEKYFQKLFGSEEVAVFTGTVGKNRKAVAAICANGKATHFIKIPISENARQLINTEEKHLRVLSQYDFEKLSLPVAELNNVGLKLTNIRPQESLSSITITNTHLQALKDLYANTFQVKTLSDTEVFRTVIKNLSEIKNTPINLKSDIPSRKVERLNYNIKLLFNTFEQDQVIPVAYAHGDFTPWNMFVSEKRIHSYDWELAMPEQTLLFDAFHFIFQSSILVLHQSFDATKNKIEQLKNNPIVVDLIERYRLDFWECYRWYLICNCSYYLNLYMKQDNLHKQALWLVDCWIDATNDAIKQNKPKVVEFA